VDVAVGGTGLGLGVIVAVGGGAVTVTVGGISGAGEQAKGPKRSVVTKIARIIA